MNTKKMLAILAALSMLGTTGLTVGAEDTNVINLTSSQAS